VDEDILGGRRYIYSRYFFHDRRVWQTDRQTDNFLMAIPCVALCAVANAVVPNTVKGADECEQMHSERLNLRDKV